MVIVYYANINNVDYQSMYKIVPAFRQKKADKYVHRIDQVRSVTVFYLLMKLLKDNHVHYLNNQFKVDKNGKLYLKDNPVYFNLAHSGNYVIVAISDKPVGVDVEIISNKLISNNLVKYVFNQEELDKYRTRKDKKTFFYRTWCKKESYVKCNGQGLGIELTRVNFNDSSMNKISFNTFIEDGHAFAICSISKSTKLIKKINL